ncbi:MAG: Asp-tRNA(Asn)/Glu-tRNA(Gln) amidotransferase subunit GatA [Deltaproteobacteria bacterium]|nr:Asp-tRNA(Asn)/Glu-tRNA(Gln) amidotransferase subunit GatA [Candidatus Anaeroferrophillacea bacterium]
MPEKFPADLTTLRRRLLTREVTSTMVTRALLERIAVLDERLGAYLLVDGEGALAGAAAADERLDAGTPAGPLDGIPLALKDILSTRGRRTTCGSRMLEHFVPAYDATVVERLHAAGAVVLGKLNMDEFAMGSSTENSAFKPTRNPWAPDRVPGGSSGGSAAAVAAGLCAAALGSDTGGSIRQPASFCGVVGMKPTYGRVSRYGLVAFASSLDQLGPVTRTVSDAALLLGVMAGHDPRDSTSVNTPVPDYVAALGLPLEGLAIGVPREYFIDGMEDDVRQAVQAAIDFCAGRGARVEEVSLPHTEYAVAAYYLIATAEASSNLARYDGVKYGLRESGGENLLDMYLDTRSQGFGPEVKRRIMLGTYALSAGYYDAYYRKAQQVRTLVSRDFARVFERVDLLMAPVTPTVAFRLGEKIDDPLQMYLNDILTIPVNLAGLPAISVPCGFSAAGLPVGLQIIGRPFAEETILAAARCYEEAHDWVERRPEL